MQPNHPRGGLSGLISRAYNGVGSGLVSLFVALALAAAAIAIVKSVQSKTVDPLDYWYLLCLGFAAILAELLGLKELIKAWWSASTIKTAAWAGIWAVGFGFSIYSAFSAAGTVQVAREGVQKAKYAREMNAEDGLKAAKDERARLELRLSGMNMAVNGKAVRTVESAEADIRNAKTNRLWDATDACTDVRGNNQKRFCDAYAALLSEKALAAEKVTLAEELKAAKAEVSKYEQIVANGGTRTTTDMTPFVHVASYVGMDRNTASLLEPAQAAITTMLLVSFAGLVLGMAAVEGTERKRWFTFNWRGAITRARRLWDGTDHTVVVNRMHTVNMVRGTDGAMRPVVTQVSPI